jgi:hypothetical protein
MVAVGGAPPLVAIAHWRLLATGGYCPLAASAHWQLLPTGGCCPQICNRRLRGGSREVSDGHWGRLQELPDVRVRNGPPFQPAVAEGGRVMNRSIH